MTQDSNNQILTQEQINTILQSLVNNDIFGLTVTPSVPIKNSSDLVLDILKTEFTAMYFMNTRQQPDLTPIQDLKSFWEMCGMTFATMIGIPEPGRLNFAQVLWQFKLKCWHDRPNLLPLKENDVSRNSKIYLWYRGAFRKYIGQYADYYRPRPVVTEGGG